MVLELAKADFRKRFVGSYFGVIWMFIQPLVTMYHFDLPAALDEPCAEALYRGLLALLSRYSATLDDLEKRVAARRTSLEKLKQTMRDNQALLAPGAMAANGTGLVFGPSITTPSMWPARGEVSSPYGLRWGGSDFHPGIDIANDMGTPIVATADGTVAVAGWNSGGYGNMVDIDHGNGLMTRYGHAMQVVVVPGQHVRRGQVIAYMGSTGYSTGPHVHYEVRINGSPVNPVGYL